MSEFDLGEEPPIWSDELRQRFSNKAMYDDFDRVLLERYLSAATVGQGDRELTITSPKVADGIRNYFAEREARETSDVTTAATDANPPEVTLRGMTPEEKKRFDARTGSRYDHARQMWLSELRDKENTSTSPLGKKGTIADFEKKIAQEEAGLRFREQALREQLAKDMIDNLTNKVLLGSSYKPRHDLTKDLPLLRGEEQEWFIKIAGENTIADLKGRERSAEPEDQVIEKWLDAFLAEYNIMSMRQAFPKGVGAIAYDESRRNPFPSLAQAAETEKPTLGIETAYHLLLQGGKKKALGLPVPTTFMKEPKPDIIRKIDDALADAPPTEGQTGDSKVVGETPEKPKPGHFQA